jgi:hypothetical protein
MAIRVSENEEKSSIMDNRFSDCRRECDARTVLNSPSTVHIGGLWYQRVSHPPTATPWAFFCGYHFNINAMQSFRFLSDEKLLAQCRVDHYRGSGPGGQKRNKTSNAVRLAHLPSGVVATATESRSTRENHLQCMRRLRIKLAAEIREPLDPIRFEAPDWFLTIRHQRRIDVSHRHEFYAAAAGLMLDLLTVNGNPAAVAANLGITTTAVIQLLQSETAWWAAANAIRVKLGMEVLQSRGS